jgi:hypothetical protein
MLLNVFYTESALGIKNEIMLRYRLNGIYSSISYVNIQNEHPSTQLANVNKPYEKQ